MSSSDSSIYEDTWTADQDENGFPAILPSDTTTPRDKGYVIVNESTNFDKDTRLLQEVFIPNGTKKTDKECVSLLSFYEADCGKNEFLTCDQDEDILLDFILDT